MKEKNIKIYGLIIGIVLFILLLAGLSYAWYAAQAQDTTTVSGEIGMCFEVNYLKGGSVSGSDLLLLKKSRIINNGEITITNGMAVTSISAGMDSTTCPDTYGYMDVYMKNTSLNNAFISGNSAGALKYVIASYDSSQYPTATVAALSGHSFDIVKEGTVSDANDRLLFTDPMLPRGTMADYLVIFYLDGDLVTNDGAYTNFSTTISATASPSVDGSAKSYISNLAAPTSTIVNNNITYSVNTNHNMIVDTMENVRFYGASPDNYIYFNCDTYPDTNCELWRVIGVVDGKVKLMRDTQIGIFSWDTSVSTFNEGKGINQWGESTYISDGSPYPGCDLMKLLNPGYENNEDLDTNGNTITVNNSLYYNKDSGTCYGGPNTNSSGSNNVTKNCDFSSNGIKNVITRNKIANITYYMGMFGSDNNLFPNAGLTAERSATTYNSAPDGVTRTATWNGRIAVPYPSDYAYASDLSTCNKNFYNYNDANCKSTNWMYKIITNNGSNKGWLLSPGAWVSVTYRVWFVDTSAYAYQVSWSSHTLGVTPVIYLPESEVITSGIGTNNNPFRLSA